MLSFVFFVFLIWQGLHFYFLGLTCSHTLVVKYYLWFGHFAVALYCFTHPPIFFFLKEYIIPVKPLSDVLQKYVSWFLFFYYNFVFCSQPELNKWAKCHSLGWGEKGDFEVSLRKQQIFISNTCTFLLGSDKQMYGSPHPKVMKQTNDCRILCSKALVVSRTCWMDV